LKADYCNLVGAKTLDYYITVKRFVHSLVVKNVILLVNSCGFEYIRTFSKTTFCQDFDHFCLKCCFYENYSQSNVNEARLKCLFCYSFFLYVD